jgi:transcriptional regulator with XRE-family HTH domain
MSMSPMTNDRAILADLGRRLEQTRLGLNMTQQEVAARSGVARKAVQRLESGEPVTTTNLVRVLSTLGLTDALDLLAPEPAPSPVDLYKLRGKARRRASGQHAKRRGSTRGSTPWRWGDELPSAKR